MVKKYHHGGSHGYTGTTGSYGREEQAFAGESNVPYDPGHKSESDKGSSQENKGTGTTGHKLLDALNKLKAEGKGDTEQAKVYERYLVGVEQKYQSEGKSLYEPGQSPLAPGRDLTEWEKIYELAGMEAGDPFDPENRYVKSFAGQEFKERMEKLGIKEDNPVWKQEWTYEFGMPNIVATQYSKYGEPIKTTKRTTEYGEEIPGGKYMYSGLGKSLMDQLEGATGQTSFDYGTAKEAYWDDRAAQESINQSQRTSWGGYDGGGGGASGTGYYGDPRKGNPVEQMANFYAPQSPVLQGMINVHQTPTVFAKRGGIVSLLRL